MTINITPQAAEQIRKSAAQPGLEQLCLRLAARLGEGGVIEYGMGFDAPTDGDTKFESEGIAVLVAAACVELLAGATLDYVEINPGEERFIFINPNDPSHKAPKPTA